MTEPYYIKSFCAIKNNKIILNGSVLHQNQEEVFSSFIKTAYKTLETKYPKFFKMDSLSKLGFLTADVLLKCEGTSPEKEENIALVFANKASSLDTDRKHQESIQDKNNYYPSPAVFVYTLPNICLGEISIKYKLYSENSFFIFDRFKTSELYNYATNLLANNKADKVLCAWVDFDGDENYESFMYLVEKNGDVPHTEKEIITLYNNLKWKH